MFGNIFRTACMIINCSQDQYQQLFCVTMIIHCGQRLWQFEYCHKITVCLVGSAQLCETIRQLLDQAVYNPHLQVVNYNTAQCPNLGPLLQKPFSTTTRIYSAQKSMKRRATACLELIEPFARQEIIF